MQKIFPSTIGQKTWRKETKLDLLYLIFAIFITINVTRFLAAIILTLISLANSDIINSIGTGNITAVNTISAFILLDFSGYWIHRLAHTSRFWKFHSIHHSSSEIDWLSSNRFHPLESVIIVIIGFNLCLLLGLDIKSVGLALAVRSTYGYVVHANVTWNYGPLGYIIASPYFHRWHHTQDKEALDKNFAGVFSFWDFLFGTAYMPKNIQPRNFGIKQDIGSNFWQHLLYPFK